MLFKIYSYVRIRRTDHAKNILFSKSIGYFFSFYLQSSFIPSARNLPSIQSVHRLTRTTRNLNHFVTSSSMYFFFEICLTNFIVLAQRSKLGTLRGETELHVYVQVCVLHELILVNVTVFLPIVTLPATWLIKYLSSYELPANFGDGVFSPPKASSIFDELVVLNATRLRLWYFY